MRTRSWLSVVAFSVLLAACAQGGSGNEGRGPSDLLILSSRQGLTALDSGTGSVLFSGEAAPALGRASELFTTAHPGTRTIVRTIQATTGHTIDSVPVAGTLAIRTISSDGLLVALMRPLPLGSSPWTPRPRVFTDLTVADTAGAEMVQRFHLKGNFEPEAFSTDDRTLYMIQYVPATAPHAYRVVRLTLGKGTVSPVYGRYKTPPETMTGTRLMQVPSADGRKLFTLYTSQPASYATGYDSWQARSSHPVAFVHTLSLAGGWAVCIPLPGRFGTGDPRDEALAASSTGMLYVVDSKKGLVAEMDPEELKVIRTVRVDFGPPGSGQTHAAVSPDGRALVVATGSTVVTIDTLSLQRQRAWRLSGAVDGLGFSPDGRRLYVVEGGEIRLLDPSTGREMRMMRAPGATGLEYVAALGR